MLESWSTLSALAALVPRMRVGTIVLGNTYRHPAVVAKMAAQVDIISGGRLLLGLGAGWQENEHEAYGIPFYTMRERLERLDEACQVMRSLWTQDAQRLQGTLLPALRRAARAQAGADAPPRADDRRRRREGHPAHRGQARRSLERAGAGPQVLGRKGKILDEHCASRRPRSEDHHALGQHGAADHRQEGRGRAPRRDDRDPHGPPRRRRARHLPGRHAGPDPRAAASSSGPPAPARSSSRACSGRCRSCAATSTASSRRSPRPSGSPGSPPERPLRRALSVPPLGDRLRSHRASSRTLPRPA